MVVQFFTDFKENKTNSKIQLKFLDGPKTDQVFSFPDSKGTVKIGRMSDCEIRFDDTALSRNQCCIQFIEGQWILKDGTGSKLSTNGTWLFADELFKIFDNMVFKAGQILFQANLLSH